MRLSNDVIGPAKLRSNQWADNGEDVRQQVCAGTPELTAEDIVGVPTVVECPSTNVSYAGAYDIQSNQLSGGPGVASGSAVIHGNAVFAENGIAAWDGVTGLNLVGNTFSDAPDVAVFLNDATATVQGNAWSGDGVTLRQQLCKDVPEVTGGDIDALDAELCPAQNEIIAYDFHLGTLYLPTAPTAE